jgi:hypothetical protein
MRFFYIGFSAIIFSVLMISCEAIVSGNLTSNQLENDKWNACHFLYLTASKQVEKDRIQNECYLPLLLKEIINNLEKNQ